jgi:hypothetical protein
MSKETVLFAFLLACLLTSVFAEFGSVKAQELSINVEFVSSPPAYVNRTFEIMATASGGTPPYAYQWYTKWFPPWKPGMDPTQYVASSGNEIAVPEARSATFWFTPTVEGIYWISVGVSDSAGQSISHFPSIQPFQLIVEANPAYDNSIGTSNVEVSIISPQNETYNTNDIELVANFEAFPGVWYMGYSLDNGSYIEIAPGHPLAHNLTETLPLHQLPKGSHSIEVKATAMANDEDGKVIAFSKVYFTITKTLEPLASSSPMSSPTIPEFSWLVTLPFFAAMLFMTIKIKQRKPMS